MSHISLLISICFLLLVSCKKPSIPTIKPVAVGPTVTIQQLRAMWTGVNIKFASNTILTAVVTMDESSGQLYKQVYIRDYSGTFAATNHYGAISLHFLHGTSGFLNQGDSIAVNLNGATLDKSGGGSLQVDSIDATRNVVHITPGGLTPQPLLVTLPQLNTFSGGQFIYDAQLIQLDSVEFINPNVGTTYAVQQNPPAAPINVNKYVCDFRGNTKVAYNSGYANFAGQVIPTKSGSVIAVANLYTTMQLSLRSFQDLTLNNPYNITVYDTITQNFGSITHTYTNVGLSKNSSCNNMAGWQTFDLQGNLFWQGAQYDFYPNWAYAPAASNYKTTTARNDLWLISPPIVDAQYTYGAGYAKKMDFSSSLPFATTTGGNTLLSVLVSNTFDGTNIIPTQWTNLSDTTTAPFHNINTGNVANNFLYAHNPMYTSAPNWSPSPLPISFNTPKPHFWIAFRYQSNTNNTDSTGATVYLGTLVLKN
ncbi:MAG: DUF5689 domain-containing protein [Bacteroidia bacterium]